MTHEMPGCNPDGICAMSVDHPVVETHRNPVDGWSHRVNRCGNLPKPAEFIHGIPWHQQHLPSGND